MIAPPPPSRPSRRLTSGLRLLGWRALEALAGLRARRPAQNVLPAPAEALDRRALWVFCSTIGELNAIEPFLNRLLAELGHPPLLLISDRGLYTDAFRAKYPQALIATLDGTAAAAQALACRQTPLMLLVAEIPCRLHDAPCRFAYATVHAVQAAGAPVVLVNGWLYGYAPPSRMDLIEHRWFARDYVQAFELMLVQTAQVRTALLAAGADPERVLVSGNIKFDAMANPPAPTQGSLHEQLLRRTQAGPLIVAGSVTETTDQRSLLTAFTAVQAQHPGALLVLAPRHPENQPRMQALREMLAQGQLAYRFRSGHAPVEAVDTSVLILDTMGELRGCYAAATLAFVGNDHNVLEPLAYSKPVFVGPGWEATYPSYPVYRQLLDAGALQALPTLDALGAAWMSALAEGGETARTAVLRAEAVLAQARGAVDRNLAAMQRCTRLAALMKSPSART
jgi:3-deoxy-D-manno-octulosonic-acid transferase